MSTIKPCPFCGNAPRSGWNGCSVPGAEDCGYWGIDCCYVHVHADGEDEASAIWNRRAQPPARVEVTEAMMDAYELAYNNAYNEHIIWCRNRGYDVLGQRQHECVRNGIAAGLVAALGLREEVKR